MKKNTIKLTGMISSKHPANVFETSKVKYFQGSINGKLLKIFIEDNTVHYCKTTTIYNKRKCSTYIKRITKQLRRTYPSLMLDGKKIHLSIELKKITGTCEYAILNT